MWFNPIIRVKPYQSIIQVLHGCRQPVSSDVVSNQYVTGTTLKDSCLNLFEKTKALYTWYLSREPR